uniref:Uncharacterized protein n=1 Tax=Nelumbo nucifera TaxID=4432 RepID=A0A822Y712_NELNU|nr:TPA_asm: hypothetical protein HUJ06_028859 [Nelumbo nucifera]
MSSHGQSEEFRGTPGDHGQIASLKLTGPCALFMGPEDIFRPYTMNATVQLSFVYVFFNSVLPLIHDIIFGFSLDSLRVSGLVLFCIDNQILWQKDSEEIIRSLCYLFRFLMPRKDII